MSTAYYLTDAVEFISSVITSLCKEGIIYYHHTATATGYIKVGNAEIDLYEGRFGKGIAAKYNNPISNRYCIIEYYITDNTKTMCHRLLNDLYGYRALENDNE